jgi:hypothetical protein
MIGGVVSLAAGFIAYPIFIVTSVLPANEVSMKADVAIFWAGTVAIGLGALAVTGGFLLVMQATGVRQSRGTEDASRRPSARNDLGIPTWRDQSPEANLLPKVTYVPMFSTTF